MKALRLHHNDFVQVAGPDSKIFLQGQVSCNMELLNPGQSLTGVLCNLKGRVIADFRALEVNSDVWLQTEKGMGQILIDVLSKYSVFSKVEISLLTEIATSVGVFGNQTKQNLSPLLGALPDQINASAINEDLAVIQLPTGANDVDDRFEIIPLQASGAARLEKLLELASPASEAQWRRLDIEAGIIHVQNPDSELHTPQLLNYDISGVIDFKKGCYTGQEIVARMFYRSTAKKRLFLLGGPVAITPQHRVRYWEKGKSHSAEILRYNNADDNGGSTVLLVIMGTEANDPQWPPQLSLETESSDLQPSNNTDSSLQFLTLPYTEK